MIDPLSAVGIAAAVLQFVDFSTKLIGKTREITGSSTGALAEHVELAVASQRLKKLNDGLSSSISKFAVQRKLSEAEAALRDVSVECQIIALQFSKALDSLMGDPGQNVFKSFRQAFKAAWRKNGIDRMRQRLNEQRQQLVVHLLIVIR